MQIERKLVQGVGVNNLQQNSKTKSYVAWKHMLERCYSNNKHNSSPTYINCTVCNEWKSFSNFKQWFDNNYVEGFELDKDVLVEGNKIYSPDTCRFIPQYLNTLLSKPTKGAMPTGISKNKEKFLAQCNDKGKRVSKLFKTVEEASSWYSSTKHQVVKERAIEAFLAGEILSDVASALINRKF